MSYEVLVVIVMINVVVTLGLFFWLREMAVTKANRPVRLNKKAAKLLWHSDPIVPHDPPKIDVSKFSGIDARANSEFFIDFKEFADVVNSWLVDFPREKSLPNRFRLQDKSEDVGIGRLPRRSFALYYNQWTAGELKIYPQVDYTTETPHVRTEVKINCARYLRYWELTEFLWAIASHVANRDPYSDNISNYTEARISRIEARLAVEAALTEALWVDYENYRGRYGLPEFGDSWAGDWGDLELSFNGSADFYISRRTRSGRGAAQG